MIYVAYRGNIGHGPINATAVVRIGAERDSQLAFDYLGIPSYAASV